LAGEGEGEGAVRLVLVAKRSHTFQPHQSCTHQPHRGAADNEREACQMTLDDGVLTGSVIELVQVFQQRDI
jgi:hypothetical protein